MSESTKSRKKEIKKIPKEMLHSKEGATGPFDKKMELHWNRERQEKTGDSILHVACRCHLPDVVKNLLATNNADVHWKNKDDRTPLHEAAQHSFYEACEMLLDEGADVNALKRGDWTPLMLTCAHASGEDSLKTTRLLLERGAEVNVSNKDGWNALHLICRTGDSAILRELLKYGAHPFSRTKNGRTGLHIAALHGNTDIVIVLLGMGLEPNDKDSCGSTALHEAVLGNNVEVCRVLINNKATVGMTNGRGYTILHLAASAGCFEPLEFILTDLGWDVNEVTTIDGLTALHCAVRKGHISIVEYLKNKGANEFIKDKFGRDAFSYASS